MMMQIIDNLKRVILPIGSIHFMIAPYLLLNDQVD